MTNSAVGIPSGRFLRGSLINALSWTTVGQLASHFIRIAGSLITTRIFAPELFGLMSVVISVQVILALFSDIGIRPTVIQSKRGDDPDFLNTAWTIQILRGFAICLVTVLIACCLYIASIFGLVPAKSAWGSPQLPLVLLVVGLSPVISAFESTKSITAYRDLRFSRVIVIGLIAQVGSLALTAALGIVTRSIWALVAGLLSASLITTIMSHAFLPGISNRLAWDRDSLAHFKQFGGWVLLSSIVFVLSVNVDRLLLAGFLPPAELGLYAIGVTLVGMIEGVGTSIISSVAYPALCDYARSKSRDMRSEVMKFRVPLDMGFSLAAGFIFAFGQDAVDILFDERYSEVGIIAQLLSFSLILVRYGIYPISYFAMGRPDLMALLNTAKLTSAVILIPVAFAIGGFKAAVLATALHSLPTLPIIFWFNRKMGLNTLRVELLLLPMWAAGFLLGEVADDVLIAVRSWFGA